MKKPSLAHKPKPKKSVSKASVSAFKKEKKSRAVITSVAHKNSSNPKILRLIETRDCLQREKQAHHKFIWKTIADACTFGNELKNDEEAWQEFCDLDWGKLKGPKVNQRDQAIRFAMKFIFAKGKKGEKRASFYYNAVMGIVEKGLEGKPLVKAIEKAGGLKKLQSQKSNKNKPREKLEGLREDSAIYDVVDKLSADNNGNHDLPDDDDDDIDSRYRMQMDEGEDDSDESEAVPKQVDLSVQMPFTLIFPRSPFTLTRSKLPFRVRIKGEVVSFGKSTIMKVAGCKVKKPKA
ncbi:hypothetical protein ACVMIX_003847 [Rhizobium leguminosarum]